MIKAHYKLVRDKIPILIKKSGKRAITKKITKPEFKHYLKIKLKEEIDEILKTNSKSDITERIADILEVIEYLSREYRIKKPQISKIRKRKLQTKGKFDKRKFLVLTED